MGNGSCNTPTQAKNSFHLMRALLWQLKQGIQLGIKLAAVNYSLHSANLTLLLVPASLLARLLSPSSLSIQRNGV